MKFLLMIVIALMAIKCFGQSDSIVKKAININEFVQYFVCPPLGTFTASDVVKIKFYISTSNEVKFIETISGNAYLKKYAEDIFKTLPPKAFTPFHQVNGDTLLVPLKFSSCIPDEQIDEKKKRKK